MATLNLGRIKPVFQGAYSGSTAYVVDDIVTFGDETFICIQASTGNATSNASYWTKLAAKGTDGTDVGTTITTQGDILYRDGSGLQRLGAGTSGHFLKTQGTGANPIWAESSGGIISSHLNTQNGSTGHSSTAFTDNYAPRVTLTPASTSSKFLITATGSLYNERSNYFSALTLFKEITGGASTNLATSSTGDMVHVRVNGATAQYGQYAVTYIDAPNTTSELKYQVKYRVETSSDTARINYNNTMSQMTVIEF